jgi:hypothetical protein
MYTKQELIEILSPAFIRRGHTLEQTRTLLQGQNMAELMAMFEKQKASGVLQPGGPVSEAKELSNARETAEQLEEIYERRLEANATRAAEHAIFEMRKLQEHDAATLGPDRNTFEEAAKALRGFGITEANFSLTRQVLGFGFSVSSIQQALASGALHLSLPSLQELTQWQREAVEEYNKQLLKLAETDPLAFRKLVRQEGAQMAARAQGQHHERQVQIRAEKDQEYGFEPLPEVDSYGQALDSLYFRKLSNTNYEAFKTAVRRFGAAQINERLREGIK